MQDRPTAHELLTAIGDLLQGEVLAASSGPLKHQVRVAGNLCRILERELALQPDNDQLAKSRLADVLGHDTGSRSLDELNRELAARLRSGPGLETNPEELAIEKRAWPALLKIVRGKLAVNKPGHDSYDFAPEISGETDP